MDSFTLYLFAAGIAAWMLLRHRKFKLHLPPGPPGLPLIGNLFDFPRAEAPAALAQMGRELDSDVIYMNVAGQSIVSLNSYEACVDLLEKRSIYSNRPSLVMMGQLMNYDSWFIVLMPYGEAWRTQRRLAHTALNEKAILNFRPYQSNAVHRLLERLHRQPDQFFSYLNQLLAEMILSMTYGIEVDSDDHPYLVLAEDVNEFCEHAAMPGEYLVEFLPFLKHIPPWFPGAKFKRDAAFWRTKSEDMKQRPFDTAKKQMMEDYASPSLVSDALAALKTGRLNGISEETVRDLAGGLYSAGIDTTTASTRGAFHALSIYPEVQTRAFEEMDKILEPGQLPTLDNEDALPYITAIVCEAFRWSATVPVGVPHFLDVADTYRGWHIPKNSVVLSNTYAIFYDERNYPNPEIFNPDRFIKNGVLDFSNTLDPRKVVFGFGRRSCPGLHLGWTTVWLSVACIIRTFELRSKGIGQAGLFDEKSLIRHPLPFKCSIRTRAQNHQ